MDVGGSGRPAPFPSLTRRSLLHEERTRTPQTHARRGVNHKNRSGAEAWACEPHGGSRAFRALWAGGARIGDDYVVSAGGAKAGGREVVLLDPRSPKEPLFRKLVDSQTGELLPTWDEDASVLW